MLILNRIFRHWHITIITANKFSTFDTYYHQSDLKKKDKAAAISRTHLPNLRANKSSKGLLSILLLFLQKYRFNYLPSSVMDGQLKLNFIYKCNT